MAFSRTFEASATHCYLCLLKFFTSETEFFLSLCGGVWARCVCVVEYMYACESVSEHLLHCIHNV